MIGQSLHIPVLCLPQLVGLAFELPESALLLQRHIAPVGPMLDRLIEVVNREGRRAQVLTYLELTQCKLGLLLNFNVLRLREGIKRVVLGL